MLAAIALAPGSATAQARYSVKVTGDVAQLHDARTETVVSILTPVSNAYEMVVRGQNVLRTPFKSVDEMRARPGLNGIPLLAPFANRLDETAFYANGRKYNFDMELGNVRGPVPIHGYLTGADAWKVVEAKADASGAWVTSKLEFYRFPQYMQQFPFAHTLTMTYKVSDGALEVRTRIDNLSAEPMPVSIGFHPYFQLTDSSRADWTLSLPAKTHWLLDERKIPTGRTQPSSAFWGGDPSAVPLSRFGDRVIDDIFTDLERDGQGRGTVTLKGAGQSVALVFGPKYSTVLIYSSPAPPPTAGAGSASRPQTPPVSRGPAVPLSATRGEPAPPERGSVAIEPMAVITNAMNAAHRGGYKALQSVPAGGAWEESFWIRPSGF